MRICLVLGTLLLLAGGCGADGDSSTGSSNQDTRTVQVSPDQAEELKEAERYDDVSPSTFRQVIFSRCQLRIEENGGTLTPRLKRYCGCAADRVTARLTPEVLAELDEARERGEEGALPPSIQQDAIKECRNRILESG